MLWCCFLFSLDWKESENDRTYISLQNTLFGIRSGSSGYLYEHVGRMFSNPIAIRLLRMREKGGRTWVFPQHILKETFVNA
jgi:hypothetical protein